MRTSATKNAEDCRRRYRRNPEAYKAAVRKKRGIPEATHPCPTHCECCGASFEGRQANRDHCHERFRGWLCYNCNIAIGKLGDTIDAVLKAVAYLAR